MWDPRPILSPMWFGNRFNHFRYQFCIQFLLQLILEQHPELIRGLYFGPKTIFIPPPSENDIFSPLSEHVVFDFHRGLFALILPYFAFILPFSFLFSHILSPFFLFLLHFPPISLGLFIFFPPNDIG